MGVEYPGTAKPHILVMSLDWKTELMLHQFAQTLCEQQHIDERLKFLSLSTVLYVVPKVPEQISGCHEELKLSEFQVRGSLRKSYHHSRTQPRVQKIMDAYPEIQTARFFSSGGLRIEYFKGVHEGLSRIQQDFMQQAAKVYADKHWLIDGVKGWV